MLSEEKYGPDGLLAAAEPEAGKAGAAGGGGENGEAEDGSGAEGGGAAAGGEERDGEDAPSLELPFSIEETRFGWSGCLGGETSCLDLTSMREIVSSVVATCRMGA